MPYDSNYPWPEPALKHHRPRIVGLLGEAGAGKDTVAALALEWVDGVGIALADPMKEFARDVFYFTDEQLWGPSACRNAIDERLSYDPPSRREPLRLSWWKKLLSYAQPSRLPTVLAYSNEEIGRARDECWARFHVHAVPWLQAVLPEKFPLAEGLLQLRRWMSIVMKQRNITPRYVLQTLGTEFGRAVDEDIWIRKGCRAAQEIVARGGWCFIKDVRFLNEARVLRSLDAEVWRIARPGLDTSAVASAGVAKHASEMQQRDPEMDGYVTKECVNDKPLAELKYRVHDWLVQLPANPAPPVVEIYYDHA